MIVEELIDKLKDLTDEQRQMTIGIFNAEFEVYDLCEIEVVVNAVAKVLMTPNEGYSNRVIIGLK